MRIAILLTVLCASARASAPPPPSVRVTATATSAADKAELSIDQSDASRSWCGNAGDTLTFTFDEAIPIVEVVLAASKVDRVEVKTDTQTLSTATKDKLALDRKPTKHVAIKIPAAGCVGARFVSPVGNYFYGFVYGFDRAALDAVPKFATDFDVALRHCNEAAIAKAVKFPIKHQHDTLVPDMAQVVPAPKIATYRSAADFAKGCRKGPLQLGIAGGADDDTLASIVAHPSVDKKLLRLGDWNTHYWLLAWEAGQWHVTAIQTSDNPMDAPEDHIKDLISAQLDVWSKHDTQHYDWYFAPNATLTLLGQAASVVKATDAGDLLKVPAKSTVANVAVSLSRDRKSGWLSFTVKFDKSELRASEVVVRDDGNWKVLAGMWSAPQANDAVNKAMKAGANPQVVPIKSPKPDARVLDAFLDMQKGPIDATAAVRKDLVVFGSGPGERTVGGAVFAKPWAAAWANHLPMMGDAIAQTTPSGTTSWFVGDVALQKEGGKYLVPFRLFLVFDDTLDGTWTLVHVHIATPSPQ